MLVVGDASTLKVHLHTDDPERATAVFEGAGEVSRLDVADMRVQVPSATRASPGRRRRAATARGAVRRRQRRRGADAAAGRAAGRARRAAARSRSSAATGLREMFASSACTRSTAARR